VSHLEHQAQAPASVRCAVLTISDSRTEDTDTGGRAIVSLLVDAGHQVVARAIVKDDPGAIRARVLEWTDRRAAPDNPVSPAATAVGPDVQAIITTGGTGISSRDGTYETIVALLDKQLDGFGELFRMLSFQEIGPAAMLSRACAGVSRRHLIVSLPGSEHAVRLAMTRLILPELGHLIREVSR
jgi:molybdenum cofactor biosynthesis protein B